MKEIFSNKRKRKLAWQKSYSYKVDKEFKKFNHKYSENHSQSCNCELCKLFTNYKKIKGKLVKYICPICGINLKKHSVIEHYEKVKELEKSEKTGGSESYIKMIKNKNSKYLFNDSKTVCNSELINNSQNNQATK